MSVQRDSVHAAVEDLERALVKEPHRSAADWADQMDQAFVAVKRAVRERDADLKTSGGQLVDVASARMPSPTVDRQAGDLCHELEGVLDEVAALEAEVGGGTGDLSAVHNRIARLLRALRRFERAEADVVQDAVNTDIGGGD